MYVCMYVCMYVYIVCMYVCVLCVCMYVYIVCMYVCVLCACMYVCMCILCVCMYVCMYVYIVCMYVCMCILCVGMYVCVLCVYKLYTFRDSYRILSLGGGDSTPTRGSGGMFPRNCFLKPNALRLILGHFLMHMHILANKLHSSERLCTYFVVIMPNNVNIEWILGGDIPGLPPPV